MAIADTALTNSPIANLQLHLDTISAARSSRVAHVGIGNSEMRYEDHGMSLGIHTMLAMSGAAQFDFGVFSAWHAITNDFGGLLEQRMFAVSANDVVTQSNASVSVKKATGGVYTDLTKTVVFAGTPFSGWTVVAGQSCVVAISGTGVTNTARNIIVSVATNNTLVLTDSLGGDATAVAVTISRAPAWLYDLYGTPVVGSETDVWRPHNRGAYYLSSGTESYAYPMCPMVSKRQSNFRVNAPSTVHIMYGVFAAGSPAVKMSFSHYNLKSSSYPSGFEVVGPTTFNPSNGSAGDIAWFSDTGFNSYLNRTSPGGAVNGADVIYYGPTVSDAPQPSLTGPLALLYGHWSINSSPYGYSWQIFAERGGMNRYRMAKLIGYDQTGVTQNTGTMKDAAIVAYLRAVCHQFTTAAGGDNTGTVVFHILDVYNAYAGGNDNDSVAKNSASFYGTNAASNTPLGNTENAQALYSQLKYRLAQAAVLEGVTVTPRLYLHNEWAVSDAPTAGTPAGFATAHDIERWKQLGAASDVAWAVSTTDVVHIDWAKLATCQELLQGGHTANDGTDPAAPWTSTDIRHLSPSGYKLIFGRISSLSAQAFGQTVAGDTAGTGSGGSGGLRGRSR